MDPISAIETALIDRLRQVFGQSVKDVASVPAQIDEAELERVLREAPGIYVAFLGASRATGPRAQFEARWAAYLVAANAAGEVQRRRGSHGAIGAYQMVAATVGALDRLVIEDVGTVAAVDVVNLFSPAFARLGRTVYGATFVVPLTLPAEYDLADLADFETFRANWDIPPHGNAALPRDGAEGAADAADRVQLETA